MYLYIHKYYFTWCQIEIKINNNDDDDDNLIMIILISKMELFAKVVDNLKPLTVFAKNSILDI